MVSLAMSEMAIVAARKVRLQQLANQELTTKHSQGNMT